MGWLKEGLQDLAEIQAAEDRKSAFDTAALICALIGFGAIIGVVHFWCNSEYLYSIGCAFLWLFMLPATFICSAKGGGGCLGILVCFVIVGCDIGSVIYGYREGLIHESPKAKVYTGYWKSESNTIYEIFQDKSGHYYIIRNPNENLSATKEKAGLCGHNTLNKAFCIDVKEDSAYYEMGGVTTNFVRISKEEYDKIFDMQQKAVMEQKQAEAVKNQSMPKPIQKKKKKVKKTPKPAANSEE